jgi:N-acetylglucosamine kinase
MQLIGLDAGGSKTVCYLADEHGNVISQARGPGAHLPSAGPHGVESILRHVIGDALSGRQPTIAGACLGMAGVDRPGEAAIVRGILKRIIQSPQTTIVNDALVALEAGAPALAGIVVISGTGSIAYGRDDRGHAARSGGWGYVLADEGSGYWLGRQALRAAMRQADGRGQTTSLTARLLEHYRVSRADELARKVYAGDLKPAAIALLAAFVQSAAQEGDRAAIEIVERGASELSVAARSVARRLELASCPVVLAGGAFRAVPLMIEQFERRLASDLPGARSHLLDVEPAIGAVRLAIRAARGESVVPEYLG